MHELTSAAGHDGAQDARRPESYRGTSGGTVMTEGPPAPSPTSASLRTGEVVWGECEEASSTKHSRPSEEGGRKLGPAAAEVGT